MRLLVNADDCELLRIDRVDFRGVLQDYYEYTWQQRVNWMDSLPQFASWSPAERQRCTLDTKIREHKAREVSVYLDRSEWRIE